VVRTTSLWTRGAKACPAISVVEITADGFQDSNHRCEAMKIIKDNPRNPKNYDMKLWCGTLDDVGLTGSIDPSPARWIENCSMRFVNGKLEFTTDEAE
jgi:hypothetical protein